MIYSLLQLAQSAELPAETTGFGGQLARTALSLLAVCAASWWILRYAAKRGILPRQTQSKHLQIVDRIALDARRSVVLLRVGSKVLVVAADDQGLRTLGEMDAQEFATATESTMSEQTDKREAPSIGLFKQLLRAQSKD
jgi:flagellar biogenesis protein FliO